VFGNNSNRVYFYLEVNAVKEDCEIKTHVGSHIGHGEGKLGMGLS
jgi:hypothetical protein